MTTKLKRVTPDNRNAKGVTRLVGQVLGGDGITVVKSGGVFTVSLAAGQSFANATFSGTISGTPTATGTWDFSNGLNVTGGGSTTHGAVHITPAANTFNRALDFISTGPVEGATVGPVYANHGEAILSSSISGSGIYAGFQFSVGVGDGASAVEIYGGSFGVTQIADFVVGEQVGLSSGVEILAGFSTTSNIYGGSSAATVNAGASVPQITGHEVDLVLSATGTAPYRIAYNAGNFGAARASVLDTAFGVFCGGGGLYDTGAFNNVIALVSRAFDTPLPAAVSTTSNFFTSESAVTMSRILDLRNITVSNYIIDASKTALSDGGLTLGSSSTAGSVAINGPNGGAVFNSVQSSGTARWTYGITTVNDYAISDAQNARTPFLISVSSGLITAAFGLTVSGNLKLNGSSSGSLIVKPPAAAGSNTLTLPAGTTDFSATGGTSQVVKQTSAGGAFTVATIAASEIASGAALTKTDDTNVTLTLGGSASSALLAASSLTLGWTGQLGLTRGGTAASLTASNGGIVYSTASAMGILSGTATARQMLQSAASTTPAWSTTTWPATTTINRLLWSSAANVISDLATANSSILVTDGSGVPSLSTTLPAHTLGGTISGGGNQINNVIIGTSTPLAGFFTTLSATGALTYGGVTLTASVTGTGKMVLDTAPQISTIELGAASDTTLSRASAGVLAVEGVNVLLNGGALGIPLSGTLTNCTGLPGAAGITGGTTWVPALKFGGAAVSMTTSVAAGRIIQLGNGAIIATGRITLTAKGSSTGAATITGLPTNAGGIEGNVHFSYYTNLASITSVPFGYVAASGTTINLLNSGAASIASLSEANFTNTSDFIIVVVYNTN